MALNQWEEAILLHLRDNGYQVDVLLLGGLAVGKNGLLAVSEGSVKIWRSTHYTSTHIALGLEKADFFEQIEVTLQALGVTKELVRDSH